MSWLFIDLYECGTPDIGSSCRHQTVYRKMTKCFWNCDLTKKSVPSATNRFVKLTWEREHFNWEKLRRSDFSIGNVKNNHRDLICNLNTLTRMWNKRHSSMDQLTRCKRLSFNVVKSLVFVVCVVVFLILMTDVWKKYNARYENNQGLSINDVTHLREVSCGFCDEALKIANNKFSIWPVSWQRHLTFDCCRLPMTIAWIDEKV